MPTPREKSLLSNLRSVSRETGALLATLSTVSERLAERTSETLIGTLGGVLGGIGGLVLSSNVNLIASQGVCATLGSVLGITLATILWRGPINMLDERRNRREERLFLEDQAFVADQIKKLGRGCPPELIEHHRQMPMDFLRKRAGIPVNNMPTIGPPEQTLLLPDKRNDGQATDRPPSA
jgi:hypothetical protein